MVAGRLRESLAKRLGEETIFRDKNSIRAGEDWTKAIEAGLAGEVVVLALVGPGWTMARDETGARRLDDPTDWNRVELEQALKRSRRVIPLLIDEARMPKESELPESLKPLARSNALKLRDDDWDSDVERIVQAVGAQAAASKKWHRGVLASIALAAIVAGGAGYWWLRPAQESASPSSPGASGSASSYRDDIRRKLAEEQEQALKLLFSTNAPDRARAITLIDANLGGIDKALESFPDDVFLHTLAGYAAKNVYESSRGSDILSAQQRQKYLAQARLHFEAALKLAPQDPGALNGMGNMFFYERKFDEAIKYHEQAIKFAAGSYPAAEHDLDMVKRVKSGELAFPR